MMRPTTLYCKSNRARLRRKTCARPYSSIFVFDSADGLQPEMHCIVLEQEPQEPQEPQEHITVLVSNCITSLFHSEMHCDLYEEV